MISFNIARHSVRPDVQIVEILLDGRVVSTVTPDDSGIGIRIISAHFMGQDEPEGFSAEIEIDHGTRSIPPIPHLGVKFEPW